MKRPVGPSHDPKCGHCTGRVSVGDAGFLFCPWCGEKISWLGRENTKLIGASDKIKPPEKTAAKPSKKLSTITSISLLDHVTGDYPQLKMNEIIEAVNALIIKSNEGESK